ncbi:M56 family metallopeptidase [Carnobacterium mobile]|uniref:M56 family metallopeptidase n=1 Tax=Carnobacterium mobile TaxID=2750 RepID=UPI000552852C|nr:M56 family metallopeptidase [Carnobacterium mobile]
MHYSFSSLLISLSLVSIIVLLIQYLLSNKQIYKVIRIDFILILTLVVLLRLIFPLESDWTLTLKSTTVLPTLYEFFERKIQLFHFANLTYFSTLIMIWILGSVFLLVKLIFRYSKINCFIYTMEDQTNLYASKRIHAFKKLDQMNVKIYSSNNITTPMIYGFKEFKLLLPNIDFTDDELEYIFLHEVQHAQNQDILIKLVLEILVSVYWWFLPIYILRKQIQLVLEIRVDSQVTKSIRKQNYFDYLESLISVNHELVKQKATATSLENQLASFTFIETNTLKRRIEFMIEGYEKQSTKPIFLVLISLILLIASSIILEPYRIDEVSKNESTEIVDSSDTYILKKKTGEFRLFITNQDMGVIDDVNDNSLNGIPIIEE